MMPWQDTREAANGLPVRDNFAAWFESSQAVDRDGCPLVVYHGTQHVFDAFDPEMQGDTVYSGDIGFFFTNDTGEANAYATWDWDREDPKPNVMPVFLSIQNPLLVDIDNPHHPAEAPGVWYDRYGQDMASYARDNGHDGLIVSKFGAGVEKPRNSFSGEQTLYVAFDPCQIKSAIGNAGLYLKDSPCLTDTQAAMNLTLARRARESVEPAAARCAP